MGKEFKNIDDLYRSELGGTVTEAPASVKGNIDSALGFGKRKAGYLWLGLIALLTTVGITTVLLTNMNGADQVTQLDISNGELNEAVNNSMNSSFTSTEGATNENELENRTDAINGGDATANTNNNATAINAESLTNNALDENTISTSANTTTNTGNFRTQNTASTINTRQRTANIPSALGFTPNPIEPNTFENRIGSNNRTVSGNNSVIADNGAPKGTNKVNKAGGDNSASTNTGMDNTNTLSDNNNTGNTDNNPTDEPNNPTDQTNLNNGNDSGDIASNATDPNKNNPNQSGDNPDTSDSADNGASNDNNTDNSMDVDTTNTDDETTDPNLPDPSAQNPAIIDPPIKDDYKPLMLSLTSGVNLLRSNYTANDMNEETLYDNAFSDNIGNQTNLDITYRMKNGLTFGSGLGLNNYNESYEFTTYQPFIDTTEIFETIINEYEYEYGFYYSTPLDSMEGGPIDSILFIQDSTAYPVDTVYTYAYKNAKKGTAHNGINKATYLTIPVHFGTQIIMKKFQLDLYASARFNFLMRSSGAYYEDNEVNLFGKGNSIYKPFYMDVLFASKIHYNFYKNLYLTGTVQYRPVMGNSFKEVSFNKTFDYLHFGLGLSIRL